MRREDVAIYDDHAVKWWDGSVRWVRTLQAMVPARFKRFDPEMEAAFGGWEGRDVLDLGCAGGFMTEALAARGARPIGIDPSQGAIAAARAHAAGEGIQIRYLNGVGEDLPFAEDSFDAVVCVDVLEHVESLRRTLDEVARVLRPGGLFLFDTINRNPLATFAVVTMAERVLRLLPRGAHDPAQFIRPRTLRTMLEARGFTVGPLQGLGPVGIDRRGDLRFGLLPLTTVVYIGAAQAAA